MLENSSDLPKVATPYLEEFDAFCRVHDLIGLVQADHIGLKCSSKEKYEFQRSLFEHDSRFIYQSIISKRRISIIGLSVGLETTVGSLDYLELSDQKPDGSQKDLVDHLEIVPTGCSYDELVSQLKMKGVAMKEIIRPHHTTYDIALPSGFLVKLSREMLIDKIKREEMK
jgi:predicted metalloenzyme YecM